MNPNLCSLQSRVLVLNATLSLFCEMERTCRKHIRRTDINIAFILFSVRYVPMCDSASNMRVVAPVKHSLLFHRVEHHSLVSQTTQYPWATHKGGFLGRTDHPTSCGGGVNSNFEKLTSEKKNVLHVWRKICAGDKLILLPYIGGRVPFHPWIRPCGEKTSDEGCFRSSLSSVTDADKLLPQHQESPCRNE